MGPLALTVGEPAGIGPDITLMAWADRRALDLPAFYCLCDSQALAARASRLGLEIPIRRVTPREAQACFAEALPVVELETPAAAEPGLPRTANADGVMDAIARAVADVRTGAASAVVTNPINKKTLYEAGFAHPGHTEFLAKLAEEATGRALTPVMMLAGPALKTVPVTIHIPLADVSARLTREAIVATGRITAVDLRERFGVEKPRLLVTGLNPHAGEGGTLGSEDAAVIAPAVGDLVSAGIDARGPVSADVAFHPSARQSYDAVVCMYHDQALIPVKTLDFAETVNVTLGLPFIRTSPDHGTAFDVAGTGRADPSSLIAALRLADKLARHAGAGWRA